MSGKPQVFDLLLKDSKTDISIPDGDDKIDTPTPDRDDKIDTPTPDKNDKIDIPTPNKNNKSVAATLIRILDVNSWTVLKFVAERGDIEMYNKI